MNFTIYNLLLNSSRISPGCDSKCPLPLPLPLLCRVGPPLGPTIISAPPRPCPRALPRPEDPSCLSTAELEPWARPRPRPPCPCTLCEVASFTDFLWLIARETLFWITLSSSRGIEGIRNFWTWVASRIWAVFKIRSLGLDRCSTTRVVLSVRIRSW